MRVPGAYSPPSAHSLFRKISYSHPRDRQRTGDSPLRLRLGVTLKSVTLGNVTMSHRTERGPPNALRLSHSTMIGLPRAALENSA
ncbi:hypothetical protein EVAR_8906_1 [Eumeta japonica]|uniref:Uncharacterized protein n=1 Tax=Eumeta variegata TaxID=151549 RepID=A0A4C1U1P1_EUMVA|nr:hypothetical protein EVAR_8906_1 [Eumeta japonica]